MYEAFGATGENRAVRFRLFVPDRQRQADGSVWRWEPHIEWVRVTGDFQNELAGDGSAWSDDPALTLSVTADWPAEDPQGTLYELSLGSADEPALPDGFYEYKYRIKFSGMDEPRMVADPCAKYGGTDHENSGFVVYEHARYVPDPLPGEHRRSLADLVIYELMLDDFTAEFRDGLAPADAAKQKLDYLKWLGVNAVQFMPWTAWMGNDFSWGYDPYLFFSVEQHYLISPAGQRPATYRLRRLKELIDACHDAGLMVIMDAVLNHTVVGADGFGFPYAWTYRDPDESPFLGGFAAEFDGLCDLNFHHRCTNEFIIDTCKYWMDAFRIDGIRFDMTTGIYDPGHPENGLAALIPELRRHARDVHGNNDFILIIEHMSDDRDAAVGVTNQVNASGNWHDPLMFEAHYALETDGPRAEYGYRLNTHRWYDDATPVTYIENHDSRRVAEVAGGGASAYRTQPHAIALMTLPGAPMIYNGQAGGDDRYVPPSGYDGRTDPRPMRWDRLDEPPGEHLKWLYKTLIEIRRDHPALRGSDIEPRDWPDWADRRDPHTGLGVDTQRGLAAYRRWGWHDGGWQQYLIVLNFMDHPQQLDIPVPHNGDWEDLLSGDRVWTDDQHLRWVNVPGHYGRIWWSRES